MSSRENRAVENRADGGSSTVGSVLTAVVAEVRDLVGGFDASVISAADAAVLVARFAELERLAVAGRLLAAGRMARTSAWAGSGDADVAEWMARTTGQSRSDARKDLAAARVLDELDGTQDALRQGRLTKEQVREIAPAAKAAPGSEGDLLSEAARGSVEGLARKARAAKAAARGDGRDVVERIRRRRTVTHGRGEDGSAWLRAAGPPDDVARILAGLAPWAEHARRAASTAGEVLTDEQAGFDGLVALAAHPVPRADRHDAEDEADDGAGELLDEHPDAGTDGDDDLVEPEPRVPNATPDTNRSNGDRGNRNRSNRSGDGDGVPGGGSDPPELTATSGSPRWATKVIVNIDLAALRRGFTIAGERCEITGIGPVPVATIDDLLARDDTFLAAVLRDGTDIQKVAHLGRAPTAAQRTALEADHATCCIDGCPNRPTVVDHHHRFADHGPRTLVNLGPLCDDHDRRKTHDRWVLVRHGRSRRLVPPSHPLAAGAIPGGCIDLDDDGDDAQPTTDARAAEGSGGADGGSSPPERPLGRPDDTGRPPQAQPGEAAQLDLLAG